MYYAAVGVSLFVIFVILSLTNIYRSRFHAKERKISLPTDWPVLGMLPGLLLNCNRFHDYLSDVLEAAGGTFFFKGPWFSSMDMMVSSDPDNVHHILGNNAHIFQKGPEFKKIFEFMGDGIFIQEGKDWENQRKTGMALINHPNFKEYYPMIMWEKTEKVLIPMLDRVAETGKDVDIQRLLKRLTFDCSCIQVLGHDPSSLNDDMPYLPHQAALDYMEEAWAVRHITPESSWKIQEWLRLGKEHMSSRGNKSFRAFLSSCISLKYRSSKTDDYDLLSGFLRTFPGSRDMNPNSWTSMMLNLIGAGKDTISAGLCWFFWLVATHPEIQKKIRKEIMANLSTNECRFTNIDEFHKLIYLHGAICETLRLYPPAPLQHRAPTISVTLPSGHKIKSNTKMLLSYYAMGRKESIWGKDCLVFKPERWISETGSAKYVAAHKFPAFNGGPRSCLGKDMALNQMKIVATTILNRFKIEIVEAQSVQPSDSIILSMKHGLKIKLSHYVD